MFARLTLHNAVPGKTESLRVILDAGPDIDHAAGRVSIAAIRVNPSLLVTTGLQ